MSSPLALADRADIHRSCKSLEVLLNILNDYCEAAAAVVLLQKKLTRALRDTASLKITANVAANALNASANIFEALSEIDSKFAKVADKEFDGISTEVKKWFRKLSKDEKAHDDKISSANAKIKQAGQIYEKKAKKNAHDAAEEHVRYINLISTLGPDIAQEKHVHTLNVTERQVSMTYSVAACLSRVADAEWLRSCEGVRRFSRTVGQLGKWRAFCEGGWTGPVPQELLDNNNNSPDDDHHQVMRNIERNGIRAHKNTLPLDTYNHPHIDSEQGQQFDSQSASRNREVAPHHHPYFSGSPIPSNSQTSLEPPRPFTSNNTDSIRSLSAFPSPPTHFPLPPSPFIQHQPSQSRSYNSSSSQAEFMPISRRTESPLPDEADIDNDHVVPTASKANLHEHSKTVALQSTNSEAQTKQSNRIKSQASLAAVADTSTNIEQNYSASKVDQAQEIAAETKDVYSSEIQAIGPANHKEVERRDTGGSTSSIVATMRNRYSSPPEQKSPTLKHVPRIPLSVPGLALRYQPISGSSSPNLEKAPSSPTVREYPVSPPLDTVAQARQAEFSFQRRDSHVESLTAQKQANIALNEQELRERERNIDHRARDLEKDRQRLMNVPTGEDPQGIDNARSQHQQGRGHRLSLPQQLRYSPTDQRRVAPASGSPSRPNFQHASSATYPTPLSTSLSASSSQQSPILTRPQLSPNPGQHQSRSHTRVESLQHPLYCGCDKCYRSPPKPPSPHDLRPPAKPLTLRPEKPKGWMRRLSMPAVSHAFSLDSKRGSNSNVGIAGGIAAFTLDGKKNASTTNIRHPAKGGGLQEDGRVGGLIGRFSYESGGLGNRSMTNLRAGGNG